MNRADRYPSLLLLLFTGAWVALAIAPVYRQDWLLENVLVFAVVPWLVLSYRRLRFTNAAYTCFFVFLLLHALGAHYTYAEVPYQHWFASLRGNALGDWIVTSRNHYDRLVHFLYGVLISLPAWELIRKHVTPTGLWAFLLPWTFMLSHSVIYETLEMVAAMIFGGPLGQAYLGTQGDVWDGQKDSALAALGSAIMMASLAIRNSRLLHSSFTAR